MSVARERLPYFHPLLVLAERYKDHLFTQLAKQGETVRPREVMEAWGFEYKSNRVWDKVIGLPGSYGMQVCHEHLLIGVRGNGGQPDVPLPHDDSVLVERRVDGAEHSEKPEEMRRWIERHWTIGPYLELFGRKPVEGWMVWGNDARLWPGEEREQATA